ncbi:MAG TPA: SagB/ThcOx family dehydrogenase [Candidatus Omnitrophica bacterium]|nr:SagB/ThcOx family dehydrogenase [Candidatus Omnitrophota bacterium]
MISLPKPEIESGILLNQAIYNRYSCRKFSSCNLTLKQVSLLLWAAGGRARSQRTIPSAGATYPLEINLVVGKDCVENLAAGFYWYIWEQHALELKIEKDLRKEIAVACLGQDFISFAPVSVLISAQYEKTTARYGHRGIRYVHMEAGCVCQNIHLEAISLGLGTVVIGAFYDQELKAVTKIDYQPLAVMPVGYPK